MVFTHYGKGKGNVKMELFFDLTLIKGKLQFPQVRISVIEQVELYCVFHSPVKAT